MDDLKVSVCTVDEVAVAAERAVLANVDLVGLAKVNLGALKISIQTTVYSRDALKKKLRDYLGIFQIIP